MRLLPSSLRLREIWNARRAQLFVIILQVTAVSLSLSVDAPAAEPEPKCVLIVHLSGSFAPSFTGESLK